MGQNRPFRLGSWPQSIGPKGSVVGFDASHHGEDLPEDRGDGLATNPGAPTREGISPMAPLGPTSAWGSRRLSRRGLVV
jgi:hypothetical protein